MQGKRAGFSMLTAIAIIIMMSSISALILQTGIRSSAVTTDSYRDRQALLWGKSYLEYAKIAIMKNRMLIVENNQTEALESIHGHQGRSKPHGGYTITVQISYMGVKRPFHSSKTRLLDSTNNNPSAIVDVYVDYSALESRWKNPMRYHIRKVIGI